MRAYSFDFINRDGSIDTFQIGAFSDDMEASCEGRSALLVSLTAVAVDIWAGTERVAHIRRDAPLRICPA